jgi:hypothetical protein
MKLTNNLLILIILLTVAACGHRDNKSKIIPAEDWKTQFNKQLPLLGHRNWILVVDKAFPQQNAPGIVIINTDEALLPVLQYTLSQVNQSTHVRPILFTDTELSYITEAQVPGIGKFKTELFGIIPKDQVQTLLHDSVFVKIAKASALFRVIVLKTDQVIPYSSVFLQLDCKYWSGENEKLLRESIKSSSR